MNAFASGRAARLEGKTIADNPGVVGITKLGAFKLSEEGVAWEQGFNSIARVAGKAEIAAAAALDVTRFRKKSNRYYAAA